VWNGKRGPLNSFKAIVEVSSAAAATGAATSGGPKSSSCCPKAPPKRNKAKNLNEQHSVYKVKSRTIIIGKKNKKVRLTRM
jgi:hypothetical protein